MKRKLLGIYLFIFVSSFLSQVSAENSITSHKFISVKEAEFYKALSWDNSISENKQRNLRGKKKS